MSEQYTIDITCPSGLAIRVRGLGGAEFDLYENKDVLHSNRLKTQLLEQCTVEVLHIPAFYDAEKVRGSRNLNWDEVLTCDRMYATFEIRKAGDRKEGHLYHAKFHCDNDRCNDPHYNRKVDLNELPVIELSDEAKECLARGVNEFPYTLEDGDVVVTRLLFGRDEAKIEKQRKLDKEQRMTTSMIPHIVRVETMDGAVITDAVEMRRWIRSRIGNDWFEVWSAIDTQDGGIDTNFETYCPECGNPFDEDFNVGTDFLNPSNKANRKKRRQKRLSRARK